VTNANLGNNANTLYKKKNESKGGGNMSKLLLLTLNEQEVKVIDKIIAAISDYIRLEPMQITPASVLSFPGLEIKQQQRRVFQDGEEVNLTRLEYSTLVFLASNPRIVLTRTQIFEAVWNIESDTCHSSVANVMYTTCGKR